MERMVIKGVEFILTTKTAKAIREQFAREEAEARFERECYEVLQSAIADWKRTRSPEAWDFLSDYFKDVNGFRPSMGMFA